MWKLVIQTKHHIMDWEEADKVSTHHSLGGAIEKLMEFRCEPFNTYRGHWLVKE